MSELGEREVTLICAPTRAGGIPQWAPELAEFFLDRSTRWGSP